MWRVPQRSLLRFFYGGGLSLYRKQIMWVYTAVIVSVMIAGAVSAAETAEGLRAIALNPAEKSWLDAHPVIRVGIMDAWPPMNFVDQNGVPNGIGADYIAALNKRLEGRLVIEPAPFKESFDKVKNRQLDALMDITPKKEREAFFEFTRSYLTIPHVYVGRKDGLYFDSAEDLFGKTIALEEGYYNVRLFRENYPQVTVKAYPSTAEALGAVSRGEADGYAGNRAVVMYLIEQELLFNLAVQGRMEKPPVRLNIGVRKDWPILADILDRALADIRPEEVRKIHRRWVGEFKTKQRDLTEQEHAWLAEHPVMRVGAIAEQPPIEFFDKDGQYSGISSGFIDAIWDSLKIERQPVQKYAPSEMIERLKAGKIDVLPAVSKTPKMEALMAFSKPYLSFPVVIAMQKQTPIISGIDELEGKWVGILNGHVSAHYLTRDFAHLNFVFQSSVQEALMGLSRGDIDAFVGNLAAISYSIEALALSNLKIAAPTQYNCELSIGIRKEWQPLVPIVNKVLDRISAAEKTAIKNRWVAIRFEHGLGIKTVLKWILPAAGIAIVIIVFTLMWNRRLGREIAERKSAELKIRGMSDASHDAMIMINSRDEVVFWNTAAERMFGYTAEEALGLGMHTLFIQEEFHKSAAEGLKQFAQTGQGPVIGRVIEQKALKRDGGLFPVEIAVSSFKLGDGWYAVGSVRDITDRKAAEEEMRTKEKRLRAYFDNSLVGVTITQPVKGWLEVNDIFLEMVGYTREELQGLTWTDLSHPDDLKADRDKYGRILAGDISNYSMDKRFLRKDGSVLYTNFAVSCMRNDQGEVEMVLSFDLSPPPPVEDPDRFYRSGEK